jgi:hypothetical protein
MGVDVALDESYLKELIKIASENDGPRASSLRAVLNLSLMIMILTPASSLSVSATLKRSLNCEDAINIY